MLKKCSQCQAHMSPLQFAEYSNRCNQCAKKPTYDDLEDKLQVAEECIKGALRRFDQGCHVLYLGDTYLKVKAYEEKFLEKIKAK